MASELELTEHILSVPDFPIPGISFKDITPLLAHPAAFRASVDRLAAAFAGQRIDKVAAFDARGFIFAAPIAYQLAVPLIPIRKRGKLPRAVAVDAYQGEYGEEAIEVHTDAIAPGEQVLLVDDVIALGECMLAGCRLVERLGGQVAGCAALIKFLGLGAPERLRSYRVESLVRY